MSPWKIQLASLQDARTIAAMSRDYIESGIGWRWTAAQVQRCIRDRATNVIVACEAGQTLGFAVMEYKRESGHLVLLSVLDRHRRRGIGRSLVSWLEETALIAGIGTIFLEARIGNAVGRAFYRSLGYKEILVVPKYYRGQETAVRLARDLWV